MSLSDKPLPEKDLEHVLQHTCKYWEEARGRSFFITGGTGFFGMWLLESFCYINDVLKLNMRACVLTRNPSSFAAKAPHLASRTDLSFLAGDVRNFPFPEEIFHYVVHAGTTSSAPLEPLEMFDTIVEGTRRVLEFAASHSTTRFLFVSSGAVYGRQPLEMTHIPEDYCGGPDPMEPSSAYAEGKRAAELLCALMAERHRFAAMSARCFAFVGPHLPLDAHFAIGNFIRDALAGGPVRVGGDGTPYRSYLYSADLAIALWTILFRGASLRAYNVGSNEALSIREVAEAVKDACSIQSEVIVAQKNDGSKPPNRYVPCIERAEHELGLRPQRGLKDLIRQTVAWQQL